jgi:RNA polymerase sigma-70 factor (ECF subfamily)
MAVAKQIPPRGASDAGARGTFEQLARAQMDAIYNMALRLTRNPQEAEDLVQETLLRAYRFFDKYEQGSNFRAWMFRILKNSFINRYRKDHRAPDTVDFAAIEENLERWIEPGPASSTAPSDPEQILLRAAVDAEIEEAVQTLPPDYRMVFLMAIQEEMSYKEIAAALSIPIGTVMSRLHRARRLMQARLMDYGRRHGLTQASPADPSHAPGTAQSGEDASGEPPAREGGDGVVDISRYRRKGEAP